VSDDRPTVEAARDLPLEERVTLLETLVADLAQALGGVLDATDDEDPTGSRAFRKKYQARKGER
jgi:hypothetical protein